LANEKAQDNTAGPFRPKAFLPERCLPSHCASQIEKPRVLFSLSSEQAFSPCDPIEMGYGSGRGGMALPIDLVL